MAEYEGPIVTGRVMPLASVKNPDEFRDELDAIYLLHAAKRSDYTADSDDRLANYRSLFSPELDTDAISDIRMALDQGQPLGDARFIDSIERATGQRREIRPRGRPRKATLEETGPRDQMSLDV